MQSKYPLEMPGSLAEAVQRLEKGIDEFTFCHTSIYRIEDVSDHLSFLAAIPIPFDYGGRRSLPPMFGPRGLGEIIGESLGLLMPELLSFVLEIHPMEGSLPLGNAESLFKHWQNKLNAERMNF